MDYMIKDVMKQLNMTVHTVRHYCDTGLVPNLRYDKNGNRIFNEESVNWLMCARFLRDSGMALADIRHYFALCQEGKKTFDERYQILKELEEKTKKELEEAQKRYDCIEEKLRHCEEIRAGKCEDDCNPLNW